MGHHVEDHSTNQWGGAHGYRLSRNLIWWIKLVLSFVCTIYGSHSNWSVGRIIFNFSALDCLVTVTGPSVDLFLISRRSTVYLRPGQDQLLTKRRKIGIFQKSVWQTHTRFWPTVFWLFIDSKQYLPLIDCTTNTTTSLKLLSTDTK